MVVIEVRLPAKCNYVNKKRIILGISLLDVIAIATSIDRGRDNYPPQEWLAREGWSETQIYDLDKDIATAYGLTSFPYWVFLDKDLNVIARRAGNLPGDYVGQLLIQLANQ